MWWLEIWNGFAWIVVADAFSPKIGKKKWERHYSKSHKFGRVRNSIDGKVVGIWEVAA